MSPCSFTEHFRDGDGQASWTGTSIADDADLRVYLAGPVRDRLLDAEESGAFAAELQGLATTGLAAATVATVLNAEGTSARSPWEVGEALAECLLADHHQASWPWNMERDKRTPRASLPGADLIGFVRGARDSDALLAIGEVKTSSDSRTPPNVMIGRGGMVQQLQNFQTDPELQGTVLKWLRVRCKGSEHWPLYEAAVTRFLASEGREVILFGVLMRDTQPAVLDLENRGRALAQAAQAPTVYELQAWYLPQGAKQWPALVAAGGGAGS